MARDPDVTTEKTVWCSRCACWETANQATWRTIGISKWIRSFGWKKIEGRWVCKACRES